MGSWLGSIRSRLWGLIVGATITLAVIEISHAGWLERFSLSFLDWKFRYANAVEAHDDIVMIDLNDFALEYVHTWPWPRRFHAELISTLNELGAKAILMDMFFDDPTAKRIVDPRLDPDWSVDRSGEIVGEVNLLDAIDDDGEFERALAEAGNVYLGAIARLHEPGFSPTAVRAKVDALLAEGNSDAELASLIRASLLANANIRDIHATDAASLLDAIRIENLLLVDFDATIEDATRSLGWEATRIERHWATAKRIAARRLMSKQLSAYPSMTFHEAFAAILPDALVDAMSADREDLLRSYRAVVAERAILDRAPKVPDSLDGRIQALSQPVFALDRFSRTAEAGLVVLQVDEADKVMRRVPLVTDADGRIVMHLGFAVATEVLGLAPSSMRVDDDVLTVWDVARERSWQIPIDDMGRSLISWHVDTDRPEWQHSFEHIPASRVMEIPLLRRAMEREDGIEANYFAQFVRLSMADAPAGYADYERLIRERMRFRRIGETSDSLSEEIKQIESQAITTVVEYGQQVSGFLADGGNDAELSDNDRLAMKLADEHKRGEILAATKNAREQLRKSIARQIEQLKPLIAGRICLFGYTATAVADTVNSPVFGEMPGVLAHANVLNSMLQNRFTWPAPHWAVLLLIGVAGISTTLVTTWRDPWMSLIVMIVIGVVLHGMSIAVFYWWSSHVDVVGAFLASFLSWTFVTLYRQLTEERQKRAFSRSLAQYTSPAIAAQLADKVSRRSGAMDLSPTPREVTCFFSDLKGFTSISERLGASRTREMLNPYLEAMSRVLIDCDGMINKFMGDGIFAFFNPPVHPVADHATAACEAAVRSFEALKELKQRLAGGDLDAEVRALSMRVGVNTGEVFVGDYGSSSKLDYTCIGDTVNLAARLEPACKAFGVRCLISETTYEATKDGFVVRHLGGLQVVGKTEAVQVYELLGRAREVTADRVAYAERFGEAVAAFQRRDWDAASKLLADCRSSRPADVAIELFEANIAALRESPPDDDWNRAIELTSK